MIRAQLGLAILQPPFARGRGKRRAYGMAGNLTEFATVQPTVAWAR